MLRSVSIQIKSERGGQQNIRQSSNPSWQTGQIIQTSSFLQFSLTYFSHFQTYFLISFTAWFFVILAFTDSFISTQEQTWTSMDSYFQIILQEFRRIYPLILPWVGQWGMEKDMSQYQLFTLLVYFRYTKSRGETIRTFLQDRQFRRRLLAQSYSILNQSILGSIFFWRAQSFSICEQKEQVQGSLNWQIKMLSFPDSTCLISKELGDFSISTTVEGVFSFC